MVCTICMLNLLSSRIALYTITQFINDKKTRYYVSYITHNFNNVYNKFSSNQILFFKQLQMENLKSKIIKQKPFTFQITGNIPKIITRDYEAFSIEYTIKL